LNPPPSTRPPRSIWPAQYFVNDDDLGKTDLVGATGAGEPRTPPRLYTSLRT
jgi:hypothetical protein